MRLIFIFYLVLCSTNTKAQLKKANIEQQNLAVLSIFEHEHNFGTLKKENVVSHNFKFKNTGKVPLKIETIDASCVCTSFEFEKEPVAIDSLGSFSLYINTKEVSGAFDKLIRVIYNGDNSPQIIRIYGKVED